MQFWGICDKLYEAYIVKKAEKKAQA